MITVVIYINGSPVIARSARNIKDVPGNRCLYLTDDGHEIDHKPSKGAVALAQKMLAHVVHIGD